MRDTIPLVYFDLKTLDVSRMAFLDRIWNLNPVFILYKKFALFKTYDKFTCVYMQRITDYMLPKKQKPNFILINFFRNYILNFS